MQGLRGRCTGETTATEASDNVIRSWTWSGYHWGTDDAVAADTIELVFDGLSPSPNQQAQGKWP